MSNTVIKVENLSKQYRLGLVGSGTLKDDLHRWWNSVRGKENPLLKVGEVNDRSVAGTSDYVWSLKNLNFEIEKGDVVGIIGKNGAGKSTLLKILSKITSPTIGNVKIKGRIASLLEVGTGFHPELTGRQNIYLNGAILGMRKSEIKKKIDEIIAFAGIDRYVDTPVKRYSSGMYVRLAFAVSAHLDPDILIIDEVLAVGDADFQKKCLGKMQDVSRTDGRTILFVSHSMAAIKELCNKAILLENGQISYSGNVPDTISKYLSADMNITSAAAFLNDSKIRRGNGEVRFTEIVINEGAKSIDPSHETRLVCKAQVFEDISRLDFSLTVYGSSSTTDPMTSIDLIAISEIPLKKGVEVEFNVVIPANAFRTGLFSLYLWLGKEGELIADNYPYDLVDSLYHLNYISNKSTAELGYNPLRPSGIFNMNLQIVDIRIN
jgi:lipopolysaccharide transport system ATP-binding protein